MAANPDAKVRRTTERVFQPGSRGFAAEAGCRPTLPGWFAGSHRYSFLARFNAFPAIDFALSFGNRSADQLAKKPFFGLFLRCFGRRQPLGRL